MIVLRLGPEVRRWAVVAAAGGLLIGVLRWGLTETGAGIATSAIGQSQGRMDVSERVVALTFNATADDRLQPVVQALTQANLPGTFFVDAAYAKAHSAALRQLVRAGDEVEVLLDPGTADVAAQARAVASAADIPPLFVRPASAQGAGLAATARRAGLAVSIPSVSAPDGAPQLHPGDVVWLPAGTAGAAAVSALAQQMSAGGYQGVTLEDLAAIANGAAAVSMSTTP